MKSSNPNVTVTTEVDYCPFCRRSRTLRREERHLGGLVRTMVSCETCHQTLSSTMSPAPEGAAEPAPGTPTAEPVAAAPTSEPEPTPKPARKKTAAAAKKPASPRKTASPTRKPAAKKKA